MPRPALSTTVTSGEDADIPAVLIIAVHSRVAWSPSFVARTSQHAVLSSQTLAELLQVIPCPSNSAPKPTYQNQTPSGFVTEKPAHVADGYVVCIENDIYCPQTDVGETRPVNSTSSGTIKPLMDFNSRLFEHLRLFPKKKPPVLKKATGTTSNTTFGSLTLRINAPYWILHKGNCEHYLVVDQIRSTLLPIWVLSRKANIALPNRLLHSSDPKIGYPLTLQETPALLDLCRACCKVPAVWSIVNDIRLGETPCVLCAPCWRTMGPSNDPSVVVVPLESESTTSATVGGETESGH